MPWTGWCWDAERRHWLAVVSDESESFKPCCHKLLAELPGDLPSNMRAVTSNGAPLWLPRDRNYRFPSPATKESSC